MREKFLVSVISMGRPDGAKDCIDAIMRNREGAHIVFTSNGCRETSELFENYKGDGVEIFHESDNTFFQYPHNRSYQIAKSRGCAYLVVINDDLILPDNGLKILAEPLDKDPKVAITGARGSCQSLSPDMHGYPGGPLHYIEGSLLCLRISALNQFRENLWEPGLEGIYAEDSALSLYLQEKGYAIRTVQLNPEHARSVTVNRDEETRRKCHAFQERNHELVKQRFWYWLKHQRFDQPIIVKRRFAIGDALLSEPIIRAVKKARPLSPIYVETDYPELFHGHPAIRKAAKSLPELKEAVVLDLNDCYEQTVNTHIIDAYAELARRQINDLGEVPKITKLFLNREDRRWTAMHRSQTVGDSRKVCVICPDHGDWTGKNWPHDRWEELATRLVENGWHVVCVGNRGKPAKLTHCIDASHMFSIRTLGAYLETCQLFIGHDSAPMHVALSVGCPTIGLFGVTNKKYILTDGAPRIGVESDPEVMGSGKRHRVVNQQRVDVGPEVMDSISVDKVWRAVEVMSYE